MNESDRSRTAVWVDDRLEAYLDGDLPEAERREVERHLAGNGEAAEQLLLARRIRQELASFPMPACPPEVKRAVLYQVRAEARTAATDRIFGRFQSLWVTFLRPSIAAAALVALIIGGALVGPSRDREPAPEAAASPEEVDRALREAKWALAFVSEIGKRTGASIRRDVLEERVTAPIQQAVEHALGGEPNS